MSKCTSGCRTKDHASYAECLQSKRTVVGFSDSVNNKDRSHARKFEGRLDKYRRLRAQGIMPRTTLQRDIDMADLASNESGAAYRADKEWDYRPVDKDRLAEVLAPVGSDNAS